MRLADKLRAYDFALKEPLKHSSHRNERAMRFQQWVDQSAYRRCTSKAAMRNAWRKYQDEMARVTIRKA